MQLVGEDQRSGTAHASWMVEIPARKAPATTSTAILLEWPSILVDSRNARIVNLEYNAAGLPIGQMSSVKEDRGSGHGIVCA